MALNVGQVVYRSGDWYVIIDSSETMGVASYTVQHNGPWPYSSMPPSFSGLGDAKNWISQQQNTASNNPNVVKTTTGTNGNVTPSQKPDAPTGTNSSSWYQAPGSSLNKNVQGVIANTSISIANDNLAHACDVTANGKFIIFGTTFEAFSLVEISRGTSEASWIGEVTSPIVEAIKQVIDIATFIKNTIESYYKVIKYIIDEVQQLVQAIEEMITFIMSLPAKIMAMLANCLSVLGQLVGQCATLTAKAIAANAANTSTSSA